MCFIFYWFFYYKLNIVKELKKYVRGYFNRVRYDVLIEMSMMIEDKGLDIEIGDGVKRGW